MACRNRKLVLGTRSEWRDQARADRELFSVIVPFLKRSPWELEQIADDLEPGDLEEFEDRLKEARRRYQRLIRRLDASLRLLAPLRADAEAGRREAISDRA